MSYIFDGREFARKIEDSLLKRVKEIARPLKVITFLDESNPGSLIYSRLKEEMAKRLGIEFIKETILTPERVMQLNNDNQISGIMVQLPFAGSSEIISTIASEKDIDGMRDDSPHKPAVVVAVEKIIKEASNQDFVTNKVCVIGNRGFVGRKLTDTLKIDHQVTGFDKDNFDLGMIKSADVVIGAAGVPGLIKPGMVKEGTVLIDVGAPIGDFDRELSSQAGFFTPVPGGVGPVTVACLFENLVQAQRS